MAFSDQSIRARSVIDPVQRPAKSQRCIGSRIECRQLAFAALPSLPIGLHDGPGRTGTEAPGQRFMLLFHTFFCCLAKLRHWLVRNAAAINPVLHGASLRPGREVEHAEPPASSRQPASDMNSPAAAMRLHMASISRSSSGRKGSSRRILATNGIRRFLDAMLSSPLRLPMLIAPHQSDRISLSPREL